MVSLEHLLYSLACIFLHEFEFDIRFYRYTSHVKLATKRLGCKDTLDEVWMHSNLRIFNSSEITSGRASQVHRGHTLTRVQDRASIGYATYCGYLGDCVKC